MKTFIILLFGLSSLIFPQELNCRVTLNTESIPIAEREKLRNFTQTIEDYMNKTKFSSKEWQGKKIDCAMSVFILSASNEINYSAQVVVTSQRPIYKSNNNSLMLSINDNAWGFTYEEGQALYPNQTVFDPLTSFLDYYANIIIGFDMDSWEELGGTPFFSKAYDIVNLGASSRFSNGWMKSSSSYSRRGLVEDLLNEKFRPFRESLYDYYYGLDTYSQNPEAAMEDILKPINTLEQLQTKMDLNTVLIRVFFDAKSGEIIERLKNHPDKQEIFTTLRKIDPAHTAKYNDHLD